MAEKSMQQSVLRLLSEGQTKAAMKEVKARTHSTLSCIMCGKPDAKSACGRCKTVRYCGAQCQRAHWPTHKSECKSNRKSVTVSAIGAAYVSGMPPEVRRLKIMSGDPLRWNAAGGPLPQGIALGEAFTVKVSVAGQQGYMPHLVYDKTRSLLLYMHVASLSKRRISFESPQTLLAFSPRVSSTFP